MLKKLLNFAVVFSFLGITNCAPENPTLEPVLPITPSLYEILCAEPSSTPENFEVPNKIDLLDYHAKEKQGLNYEQIKELNHKSIAALYRSSTCPPKAIGHQRQRVPAVTPEVAQMLFDSINKHPVVSLEVKPKYDQPGVDIGYCFGRAAYIHLALLKMGVAKEAIKKAWLVGSMRSAQFAWSFHVATAVKTTDGRWMVIDNYPGQLFDIEGWYNYFEPTNKHRQDLRVYFTDPKKFTSGLPAYGRSEMGLDRTLRGDWYKHYFRDLMNWFQSHSLAEVGLPTDLR